MDNTQLVTSFIYNMKEMGSEVVLGHKWTLFSLKLSNTCVLIIYCLKRIKSYGSGNILYGTREFNNFNNSTHLSDVF